MKRNRWGLLLAAALFAGTAWAADSPLRAKLVGSWYSSDGDQGSWTVEAKGAGVVRITHSLGDQKLLEFECGTAGRECEGKDLGKRTKVSLWFNGTKLVELESKDKDVVKRTFEVISEGDSLDVVTTPIQPDGKSETLHLRRVQSAQNSAH